MKINWGTGLVIAIVCFMSFLLFMVYKTTTVTKELVAEDYYAQELAYQDRIDKLENATALGDKVSWRQSGEYMEIVFPAGETPSPVAGTIEFFRPSDSSYDMVVPIDANSSNAQGVSLKNLVPGWYYMKLDWKSNGTEYYQEERILIK